MTCKQILLVSGSLGNVSRTVWRTFILILGCKGFSEIYFNWSDNIHLTCRRAFLPRQSDVKHDKLNKPLPKLDRYVSPNWILIYLSCFGLKKAEVENVTELLNPKWFFKRTTTGVK